MIYLTGDVHGTIDIDKLQGNNFPEKNHLTKNDYLIIVGDFGAIWSGTSTDDRLLNWYEKQNYTTLFIDGNHENFDALNAYPVETWNGGEIHKIRPHVYHLMRGQVFTIEGKTFYTMGGAGSIDKASRIPGKSWWVQEIPDRFEMNQGIDALAKYDNKVDIILTHAAPYEYVDKDLSLYTTDVMEKHFLKYLDYLYETIQFDDWYFGHYHDDRDKGKLHMMYDRIIQIK